MHLRTKYFVGEDKEDKDTLTKIGLRGKVKTPLKEKTCFFPYPDGREITSQQGMKIPKRSKNVNIK